MELGNAFFGNSRGEYPVDREWQNMFCEHLNNMGFDGYGIPSQYDSNGKFDATLTSYLDQYEKEKKSKEGNVYRLYENDVFVIMSYYWGDDEEIENLPNFIYKPTGFQLSWYKYALRDSYMSHDITVTEMEEMLKKCEESLKVKGA